MRIIKTAKYIKAQKSRWTGSPGEIYVELIPGSMGGVYDITNDKDLSEEIASAIYAALPRGRRTMEQTGSVEMAIDFTSTGYSDPGSTYDPETSYPPESSDERTVKSVKFLVDGKLAGELPKEFNRIVQQEYQREMDEADMEIDSDQDLKADYEYDLRKDEPGRFGNF